MLMLPERGVVQPTKEELHELVGLARFALEDFRPMLQPFEQLTRKLHIPKAEARRLIEHGVAMGARPIEWWGCVGAIPLERVRLELWSGATWEPAPL